MIFHLSKEISATCILILYLANFEISPSRIFLNMLVFYSVKLLSQTIDFYLLYITGLLLSFCVSIARKYANNNIFIELFNDLFTEVLKDKSIDFLKIVEKVVVKISPKLFQIPQETKEIEAFDPEETDVLDKCYVCYETCKIIKDTVSFKADGTCKKCNFTCCKSCFDKSIGNTKDIYECMYCKTKFNINNYLTSIKFTKSIKLNFNTYVISEIQGGIGFSNDKNIFYIPFIDGRLYGGICDISEISYNEKSYEKKWNIGFFNFLLISGKIYVTNDSSNLIFEVKNFAFDEDDFLFRIENGEIEYKKLGKQWTLFNSSFSEFTIFKNEKRYFNYKNTHLEKMEELSEFFCNKNNKNFYMED